MTSTTSPSTPSSNSTTTKTTEEDLTNLLNNPETFSISSYLNTALGSKNSTSTFSSSTSASFDDEELQRKMAELALQLQVQTQSCHDDIGRIGAELRAILPRCAGDLGRLNVGLGGMKEDAETLLEEHLKSSLGYVEIREESTSPNNEQKEVVVEEMKEEKRVEKSNSVEEEKEEEQPQDEDEENIPPDENTSTMMSPLETLETLSTLHALQQNLTTTKSILLSVSTYDKTITSLPSLLTSSQNLNKAVSALVTIEEGARALSGMPGQEQRVEEIASTRKKILTLLKPELLHALKKMESRLGPLQTCVGMYNSLGKIESLMEEYVKNRPSSVHRLWFEFAKNKSSATSKNDRNKGDGDELEFYGDDDKELFGDDFENENDGNNNIAEAQNDFESIRQSFGEWLPTWYESVLLLLSEEQRRAVTVFGPELAPEIMAKILHECFRPIISSFKARLASILPYHARENTHLSTTGSFETICAAYEATLQFLSVAYESMVDFTSSNSNSNSNNEKEKNNSSPSRTKTAVELYHMVRSTFIAIGSPFAPYQTNFADLEANHSGMTSRVVSRDIHDAVTMSKVGSSTPLLQSMHDSVEKLTSLAPFIFPLTQAAMARFESLNSGYLAPKALSTLDTLIARHTGELSIAIHTLSTNMLSDKKKLIDSFDEQQVQYALEVLKIAGLIRRDLMTFEEKTRDRLRILMGRVSAAIDEECNVRNVITNSNQHTWSQVPDSLTAAEIEAILAMIVCGEYNEVEGSAKSSSILILQRLATSDKLGKKVALFPESIDSVSRLVKSCQTFVFEICAALPMKHLEGMSSLPVWKQEESMWSSTTPESYGTLPQAHITQVGEHMLALVQALEPFASDKNALVLANLVMEGIEHVSMSSWKSFLDAINCVADADTDFIVELMKGQTIKSLLIDQDSMQSFEEDDDLEENSNDESGMHAFCNLWLDAVCTAVTGQLLDYTMRIHHLSRKGCDHLMVDYNYIVNVFTALGVTGHPHPFLNHISEVSKMDSETLKKRITSTSFNEQTAISKVILKTEMRIAEIRGISIHT